MFDARRLTVLVEVARRSSFTLAAQSLVMTQPAASRQIAALEREVGAQLIVRGPRRVALTAAGASLVEEAERILPAIEAAQRRLRSASDPEGGAVRVAAIPSAMVDLVAPGVRTLLRARPRVELQLVEGWSVDLARRVRSGDVDLAVVSGSAVEEGAGERLIEEPYLILLPADDALARRKRLRLEELAEMPWLMAAEPGGRQGVIDACARAGFVPRTAATVAWDSAPELIAAGVGVAMVPERTARRIAGEGIVARPLVTTPHRELVLLRATGAELNPAGADLAEIFRRVRHL